MKKRRKTIYAGTLVKVVEYTPPMPRDNPTQRQAKHKTTTAAQRALNYRTAQGRLEDKLACNFGRNDYFITLTYRDGAEPRNRKEANRNKTQYLRRLHAQRKKRGDALKWVCAIENKHGKGRWHLHMIINSSGPRDLEEIISLWPFGHVAVSRLYDADHHATTWLDIARYLTKERPEDGHDDTPVGAQIYSCSRNLAKPHVVTEWVADSSKISIPAAAIVYDRTETENEYSRYMYVKYLTAPLFYSELI